MESTLNNLCNSCTNIGCEFQSGIVRTKCAFYMPPQLEPDNCGNYVVQDSTTKNDIRDNRVKNELNRVKDELEPTTKNCESCRYYGSHHEVCNYCYKCSLWTEKELTTKNDLGVDAISIKQVLRELKESAEHHANDSREEVLLRRDIDLIRTVLSVTPQEPRKGYWISMNTGEQVHLKDGMTTESVKCSECGEWLTASDEYACNGNYCPNCGTDMRG